MRKIFTYLTIGIAALSVLVSCDKEILETSPTTSMSGSSLMANGKAALVPLNGIYRSMYSAGWSTTGNTHQCFGISAYNLCADVMGDDHIMQAQGSGWFWYDAIYDVKDMFDRSTWRPYDLWNAYYTWISNANYILAAEETMEGTTEEINYAIGQAYAIRAYSYFMLAQNYARTYKGHENEPCCPIYTGPTDPKTEGQPRSTVQQVYTQITADITKAVTLLKGIPQQDKTHISEAVALGIQARIALVMEDWATAKTAAHAAITASGCKILAPASFKGVNDVTKDNVMWGAGIIADQVGMYASFFSHMDYDANKYGGSAPKAINKELYAMIPAGDARSAWWDPTTYIQKKFYFADVKTWMGDYIWMRVEEMYLTAAEAECMLNEETDAIADLEAVVKTRNAAYTCTKTGTALGALTSDYTGSLREEIINQRRIELWGEFGRIYDIRRLRQGFRRTAAQGWPATALLTTRPTDNPESYMWVMTIPQAEFDGNVNMSESDQNPLGDTTE